MILLILLLCLAPATLTRTIPPISSVNFSRGPSEANFYLDTGTNSSFAVVFPRDVLACPPPQRSIWDIIWSCLAVIFACSWASVHPDVPSPDEKWWRKFLRRIEYLIWTLLTPELIVWWAARQWIGARKIQKEQKDHGWTMAHGHFIQMGGFMLFEGKTRIRTLSYPRFCQLLRKGRIQFPDITQKEIEDRSKSNGLSKALIISQTSWFVMQCITRWVKHLTITELELLTLALAALNGMMYFFWWNKPFDVQCPVPVYLITSQGVSTSNDETVDSLVSRYTGIESTSSGIDGTIFEPYHITPFSSLHRFTTRTSIPLESNAKLPEHNHTSIHLGKEKKPWQVKTPEQKSRASIHLESDAKFPENHGIIIHWHLGSDSNSTEDNDIISAESVSYGRTYSPRIVTDEESSLETWWEKTWRIIFLSSALKQLREMVESTENRREFQAQGWRARHWRRRTIANDQAGVMHVPMFYSLTVHSFRGMVLFVIPLIGCLFGAIHCAGWTFRFPSAAELWLWRISSVIITAAPLSVPVVYGIVAFLNPLWVLESDSLDFLRMNNTTPWPTRVLVSVFGLFFVIISLSMSVVLGILLLQLPLYILARLVLLAEAILTLRDLPPGAFDVVQWTSFLPHI